MPLHMLAVAGKLSDDDDDDDDEEGTFILTFFKIYNYMDLNVL